MPCKKLMLCSIVLMLTVSGCSSTPSAPTCLPDDTPPPSDWMMRPAPDLLTPLNGIISPSDGELS
ncbi:Rz1 family lipoprotein [Escherichia coli]|uniref:Rz1 family lipoprotein n=1 Tax=Escherichia coli TaxID=562 RepID=UPI002879035A|nr:Rz1 family lipoprotein [Escherichia coli]MDS1619840.1 Rz1 family lipoprotein [Escherichia coli]